MVKQRKYKDLLRFLSIIAVLFLVNFIASKEYTRIDLTQDKRFTLTDATVKLVEGLKDVVEFKVYLDGKNLPAKYVEFREEIKSKLEEFRNLNPENIEYEFIDPHSVENPEQFVSDLRKKGLLFTNDVEKTESGVNQIQVIPGLMMYYKGQPFPVNLLKASIGKSIESIEYELVSSIKILSTPPQNKKNIGLLQGHGELFPEEIGDLSGAIFQFYNPAIVRLTDSTGQIYTEHINQTDVLLIAKPLIPFSTAEVFVLDQFVMRGGKIIWMIDQVGADNDSLRNSNFFIAGSRKLNIEELLYHYGVRINNNLLQDVQCGLIPAQVGIEANKEPKLQLVPWFYSPIISSENNHIININIDPVKLNFANTIDTIPSAHIKKTVVLSSSNYSKVLKVPYRVSLDPSIYAAQNGLDKKTFKDGSKAVAVLLEGSFDSYFKNRITPGNVSFMRSSKETKMLVISDGDIARNDFNPNNGHMEPLGMDKYLNYLFDNKKFLLNAMNYMTDDAEVIPARCKRIEMRLLNKTEVKDDKSKIQLLNIALPLVFIALFGLVYNWIRIRKYAR
ncbi:MAG: gliding motility-associated ABC transporter substrate-binding protein GldG [Bacteroidetes bacterium]|nr:gliding motility-associated ABC transporter substrate-binding protein GldG [Bacteroidota bacterium]